MSKTLDLLKQAEEQKSTKEGNNGDCPRVSGAVLPAFGLNAKAVLFWTISLSIIIMFLTLFVFDQKLYTMVKENTIDNFTTNEKLTKIENLLTDYTRQANTNNEVIKKLNGIIESMDIRIKDYEDKFTELKEATDEKLNRLKETSDAQLSSIQSLIKEKKTVFDKISALESEILNIKLENAARASSSATTTTASIE